jgi:cell division protein FtsW (lipid II flippase)
MNRDPDGMRSSSMMDLPSLSVSVRLEFFGFIYIYHTSLSQTVGTHDYMHACNTHEIHLLLLLLLLLCCSVAPLLLCSVATLLLCYFATAHCTYLTVYLSVHTCAYAYIMPAFSNPPRAFARVWMCCYFNRSIYLVSCRRSKALRFSDFGWMDCK